MVCPVLFSSDKRVSDDAFRDVNPIASTDLSVGPAQSAAVPSANDLDEDEPMDAQPTEVQPTSVAVS